MENIKTVIIDDHASSSLYLSNLLMDLPQIRLAGVASSVEEGIALIKRVKPDLVFLDINMPPLTGFDVLKQIEDRSFDVIFCTAYNDYAIDAFRVSAFDYLLKPVDPELLVESIERFMQKKEVAQDFLSTKMEVANAVYQNKNDTLIISSLESYEVVKFADIVFVEAQGSYACFHLINGDKITASKGLYYYGEMLPTTQFFQCHKTFIVNLSMIVRFLKTEGGSLIMKDGSEVNVSSRKKEQLISLLKDGAQM